ncbi:phosphatase domain-containing protein [Aurantiacibacter rhizosphaerae]|uniref:phosphatase domain-containing protein n=1 Tax=Aurantiacibacter rhizosphaerae TaxID=2691582 RepID=UPI00301DF1A3
MGDAKFEEQTGLAAIGTMLGQFISHEVKGVDVTLIVEGEDGPSLSHTAQSDSEGFVHFDVPLDPEWDLPEFPAWEIAQLHWNTEDGPRQVDAHILAPGMDGRLAVISDIDDTIIETGITGGIGSVAKNWKRVFARMPGQRAIVPGADTFYNELGDAAKADGLKLAKEQMPATRRPFFYVSSSPWNLFAYLVAFQRMRGLPLGPIKLRDWGLNRETFGKSSHGSHKTDAIFEILEMYPDMKFALIGDDTQGDFPAFASVVKEFPDQIAAVFMRTVSEEKFSAEEEASITAIRDTGIPLWMGDDYATGLEFLRANGFTPSGETQQIVKAVEGVVVDEASDPAAAQSAEAAQD